MTTGGDDPGGNAVAVAAERMAKVVENIAALPECSGPLRLPCRDLARRLRLLSDILEEIMDGGAAGSPALSSLAPLVEALEFAGSLIRSINDGSKLYQALKREEFFLKFLESIEQLEKSLNAIPFDELNVYEEVREEAELVRAQLTRARESFFATKDLSLVEDLSSVLSDKSGDPVILGRISEKLELTSMKDMKKEAMALHEMVIDTAGEAEYLEEISTLLKQLTDRVSSDAGAKPQKANRLHRFPYVPDDFWCPISREIMRDPVTVSTGQTYERASIQRWLDAGHRTCPRTQKLLSQTSLTPNYILKSLIAQWCRSNELPSPRAQEPRCDPATLPVLVKKLRDGKNPVEQRSAAGEIRLLAKRNAEDRVRIASAGAVPELVNLLRSPDWRTQEHAVTALLNLSIDERNKSVIYAIGAVPEIVEVVKEGKGSEARENAAAAVLSLSAVDGAKAQMGAAGAVPALVELIRSGTPRGKKDAAAAVLSLCLYQPNRVRAVKAGVAAPLMKLVEEQAEETANEAMALMALMVSHDEGRLAIEVLSPVKTLIEIARKNYSGRNTEHAAAALWCLCSTSAVQLEAAAESEAEEVMKGLCESGTSRTKRKAKSLLDLLQRDRPTPPSILT